MSSTAPPRSAGVRRWLGRLGVVALCVLLLAPPRLRRPQTPAARRVLRRMEALSRRIARAVPDPVVRARLEARLRHTAFLERHPESRGPVAFTVAKGKEIHLCVLGAAGQPEEEAHVVHTLVHELAHVASESTGHTPEFHGNLERLTAIAVAMGALPPSMEPSIHCGTFV